MINIADLKDQSDKQGRTYREINNAMSHNIEIGALVETESGARLFVVNHTRDCDGTPLYNLSHDKNDTIKERPNFKNIGWIGGYSEDCLTVIKGQK